MGDMEMHLQLVASHLEHFQRVRDSCLAHAWTQTLWRRRWLLQQLAAAEQHLKELAFNRVNRELRRTATPGPISEQSPLRPKLASPADSCGSPVEGQDGSSSISTAEASTGRTLSEMSGGSSSSREASPPSPRNLLADFDAQSATALPEAEESIAPAPRRLPKRAETPEEPRSNAEPLGQPVQTLPRSPAAESIAAVLRRLPKRAETPERPTDIAAPLRQPAQTVPSSLAAASPAAATVNSPADSCAGPAGSGSSSSSAGTAPSCPWNAPPNFDAQSAAASSTANESIAAVLRRLPKRADTPERPRDTAAPLRQPVLTVPSSLAPSSPAAAATVRPRTSAAPQQPAATRPDQSHAAAAVVQRPARLGGLSVEEIQAALESEGLGPEEVVASKPKVWVTRSSFQRLLPRRWLNDEVINFFFLLLQERNKLVAGSPKCWLPNSFFWPQLQRSDYNFQRVRRWSEKAKVNVFEMDLLIFPMNVGEDHWAAAIVYVKEASVRYCDSLNNPPPDLFLERVTRFLADEHKARFEGKPLKGVDKWTLLPNSMPRQKNGSDCGLFTCFCAQRLSCGKEMTFSQEDMAGFRREMAACIMKQEATWLET